MALVCSGWSISPSYRCSMLVGEVAVDMWFMLKGCGCFVLEIVGEARERIEGTERY